MLNISEELKKIYINDVFPFADEVTPKELIIYFPALNLTVETDQIVDDSFSLDESLCSETDLAFGSCEASKIKFTVADVEQDLKGQWFTIEQVIDGFEPVPLGVYKVDSCVKQDNLRFKDITAYDKLKDTDINVANWYNSLFQTGNETYTLKEFRESLLNYLGIEYEDETLPNDYMIVEKTIEPTQISGREVLRQCVELQGAFGHIGRNGKFRHIILQPAYGLYPAETLYPAEGLYPMSETDTSYAHESIIDDTVSRYQSVRFEEYIVKEIDKLQIRSEEDDIGAIVGEGSNTYVIEGNFLVYGKSASELELIARNAYGNMAKRPYRPYEAECIGLPYVEVGDTLEFATDDTVTGYVLQRTLTGIQALRDRLITNGNEEREQNFGVNKEIIQLQGKITRIKKDVEGVRVEVEDLAEETSSKFEQTYNRLHQEVTDAKNELSGQIDVLAGQVILKVDASGNIAAVELDADPSEGTSIKLKANNISLEGLVTANGNFRILPDGSMEAYNGKFSGELVAASGTFTGILNGNTIISPNISGGEISGTKITSTAYGLGTLEISGAYIRGKNTGGSTTLYIWPGGVDIYGNVQCNTINGYSPIHSGNIGNQSVYYASNSGSSFTSDAAFRLYKSNYTQNAYISANDNFIPSSNQMYIGSNANPWAGGFGVSGWVTVSDERLKEDIKSVDDRYLCFIKSLTPRIYKMKQGTTGRIHVGFVAQEVEKAMSGSGITDMEFAGLIKAPVYEKFELDDDGNVIGYDTKSSIIDHTYHLRYEEFISLLLLYIKDIESRLTRLEI